MDVFYNKSGIHFNISEGLFNNDGSLCNRFPLKGDMPFSVADINKDGALELITCEDNMVIMYSLR